MSPTVLPTPVPSRHTARQTTACNSCRQRKRRCDGSLPCKLCLSRGLQCKYSHEIDRRTRSSHSSRQQQSRLGHLTNETHLSPEVSEGSTTEKVSASAEENAEVQDAPADSNHSPSKLRHMVFGLKVGENGELEYRGPTSSTPDAKLPSLTTSLQNAKSWPADDSDASSLMPTQDLLQHHIDLFLEWQNSAIVILSGSLVDEILHEDNLSDIPMGRQLLILSIIALTSNMSRNSKSSVAGHFYFLKAKNMLLHAAFSKPSIEVVQAACILACREYGQGQENAAWTLNGIAATTGNTIGLHVLGDANRWIATGRLTEKDFEARTVTYWASVVLDRVLATCLGRHCLVHPTDFTTPPIRLRLPAESFLQTQRPQVLTFGSPDYEQSVLLTFRCSVDFWKFNDESLSAIYDFRNNVSKLDSNPREEKQLHQKLEPLVTKYRNELLAWYEGLPKSVRVSDVNPVPHALLFEMAYHNLMILMHRPFINHEVLESSEQNLLISESSEKTLESMSLASATSSAHTMTRHAQTLQAHWNFNCVPFVATHYILTASTIHLVNMARKDPCAAADAAAALQASLEILGEISKTLPIASKAMMIIHKLGEELHRQPLDNYGNKYKPGTEAEDKERENTVEFSGDVVALARQDVLVIPQPEDSITSIQNSDDRLFPWNMMEGDQSTMSFDIDPFYLSQSEDIFWGSCINWPVE